MATNFDRLPLFDTKILEANREYYVLVRADARPRSTRRCGPDRDGQRARQVHVHSNCLRDRDRGSAIGTGIRQAPLVR